MIGFELKIEGTVTRFRPWLEKKDRKLKNSGQGRKAGKPGWKIMPENQARIPTFRRDFFLAQNFFAKSPDSNL